MTRQAVALGDLVGRIDCLDVRCRRCERHGRLSLARLLDQHGSEIGLPDLAVLLAADCPKAGSTNPSERCFVWFPQLLTLVGMDAAQVNASDFLLV